MHNRPHLEGEGGLGGLRDLSLRDGLVLVPLVLAILAFALYPQRALHDSEPAVKVATLKAARQ